MHFRYPGIERNEFAFQTSWELPGTWIFAFAYKVHSYHFDYLNYQVQLIRLLRIEATLDPERGRFKAACVGKQKGRNS